MVYNTLVSNTVKERTNPTINTKKGKMIKSLQLDLEEMVGFGGIGEKTLTTEEVTQIIDFIIRKLNAVHFL